MDKNILHLILILFIVSILIKINYSYEFFTKKKTKNAICFITRNLDNKLLNFAELCAKYNDVYIVVDDNKHLVIQNLSSKVTILEINDEECSTNNYIKSTWRFNLDVTGWDKAFYYFCENNNYDNVWFIEDDVFIAKPDTIYNIDSKYNDNDLLIKDIVNITDNTSKNIEWINKINDLKKLIPDKQIYWSWVCAMRCSKKLLELIKKFKNDHKQLFFHEMLLPTLVKNNNLSYKSIDELRNIVYRKEYNDDEIVNNPTFLYHPMKDYDRNHKLRLRIQEFTSS